MSDDAPARAGDRARASLWVAVPPERAFAVFTEQIDQWWRQGLKYRIGGRGRSVLHLEPRPGGRLFEAVDGDDAAQPPRVVQTGELTEWAPPHRLVLRWRGVDYAPGEQTRVQVDFAPQRDGTMVTVTHTGWADLPVDHPARHGQAVAPFIARVGLWWAGLLDGLRDHLGRR